jgi:hypothetical protein
MKKILEYKVFDLLKDKENVDFLDKVKKENPNEYVKFLNIINNKGLELAKKKYQIYDPEYIKSELQRKKLEKTKEHKEKTKNDLLNKYSEQIDDIENILLNSPLKKVLIFIKNDKRLNDYLNNCRGKKQYKNNFSGIINSSGRKIFQLKWKQKILIERLSFYNEYFSEYEFSGYKNILINIQHYYIMENMNSAFSISVMMPSKLPLEDRVKGSDFIKYRNNNINLTININNRHYLIYDILLDVIKQLSYFLSDEYYQEWKLRNDASRYNI